MKQHNIKIKDNLGNYIMLNKTKAFILHQKIISSKYEHDLRYVTDALFDYYYSNTQINYPISVAKYELLFIGTLLKSENTS
jgi:hypothetical protein